MSISIKVSAKRDMNIFLCPFSSSSKSIPNVFAITSATPVVMNTLGTFKYLFTIEASAKCWNWGPSARLTVASMTSCICHSSPIHTCMHAYIHTFIHSGHSGIIHPLIRTSCWIICVCYYNCINLPLQQILFDQYQMFLQILRHLSKPYSTSTEYQRIPHCSKQWSIGRRISCSVCHHSPLSLSSLPLVL
jgi:hypothetical protein